MRTLLGSFAMTLAFGTGHCALHAQAQHMPAQHVTAKGDGSLEGTLTVNVGDGPVAWTAVRATTK